MAAEIAIPEAATWATVAAAALAILAWLLVRGASEKERRAERVREAEKALADAWQGGDPGKIAAARQRLDALRSGAKIAVLAFAIALSSGCLSRREPSAVYIDRYHLLPAPGEAVPPLPEGETRWHLLSYPAGVRASFPAGSSILPE